MPRFGTTLLPLFVRVKSSPNSPRRIVQVVEPSRSGSTVSQRIVRHMGIAIDDDELAKLRAMAEEFTSRDSASRLNAHPITTLYFESVQTDELREFGYAKDQKYHCTQVVLALVGHP